MSNNLFKLDENTKNLITEISALSGYAQSIVKEVYEYLPIDWAIKFADSSENAECDITIPHLGIMHIKYAGDDILESGELDTKIESSIEFFPAFKKLIGDIVDQGYTEIVPFISKKIENAVSIASAN